MFSWLSPNMAHYLLIGLLVLAAASLVWYIWRTRRREVKPLHKCVVLALLAHVLLAAAAAMVRFVVDSDGAPQPRAIAVRVDDWRHTTSAPRLAAAERSTEETVDSQPSPPVEPEVSQPQPEQTAIHEPLPDREPQPVEQPESAPQPAAEPVSAAPVRREPMAATPPEVVDASPPISTPPLQSDPPAVAEPAAQSAADSPFRPASVADAGAFPTPYRGRGGVGRSQRVAQFGGTSETEAAVAAALDWLVQSQSVDGRWVAAQFGAGQRPADAQEDRGAAGSRADTAMTGLAVLALLGAGHTHLDGEYATTVARGLDYLIRTQAVDGNLAGNSTFFARMYCHGMATLALAEAYGMTADARLAEPTQRAIRYTVDAQHPNSGGWRYRRRDQTGGDTSQLGWHMMGVRSAKLAGVEVPGRVDRAAGRFLKSVAAGPHGGLARYRPYESVTHAMTAEALYCRLLLGEVLHPATRQEAVEFLLAVAPGEAPADFYDWYYSTLCLFQLQGDAWREWNRKLQAALLPTQHGGGPLGGSWDPDPVWGPYGGRVYSTALAALMLEVYYRYLPLSESVATQHQTHR